MRLKIQSFGPIDCADIDLNRDFILIVGQNNIGKSYAISLIYALIKSFSLYRRPSHYYYVDDGDKWGSSEIKRLASQAKDRLSVGGVKETVVTPQIVEAWGALLASTMVVALQHTLNGTFSDIENLQNRSCPLPLSILLEDEKFLIEIGLEDSQLIVRKCLVKNAQYVVRKVLQNRQTKYVAPRTILYFPEGNVNHLEFSVMLLLRDLSSQFVERVCGGVADLHYLPASRSGLYQSLSAFGQIVAELSKSRTALRQKIELPGISEPLSDYYIKLSDIRISPANPAFEAYYRAAALIESEILHGTVEFESKTKRLLFKPSGVDLTLDLSATSSMVSEISPIASYLKYVLPRSIQGSQRTRRAAGKGDELSQLLILEEPEAHLHPEIQVKLIAILASLVKTTSTKIIMTSHSNYIFNKCSNLLIAGEIESEKFEAVLFRSGGQGSRTKTVDVNRFGIDDENFGDVGEDLFEERRSLIEGLRDV